MDGLEKCITIGPLSLRIGVLQGRLRRMCDRNEIPYRRLNGTRVFHLDDVETIRAACVARGCIRAEPEAVAHV